MKSKCFSYLNIQLSEEVNDLFWEQYVYFFLGVEFISSNWFCLMQPDRTRETTENLYQYINAR